MIWCEFLLDTFNPPNHDFYTKLKIYGFINRTDLVSTI